MQKFKSNLRATLLLLLYNHKETTSFQSDTDNTILLIDVL